MMSDSMNGEELQILDNEKTNISDNKYGSASDDYSDEKRQETTEHLEKSNNALASMNMINSILGSGIIGMPYTLKEAGIGLGVIFILIMGIVTDYTLNILIIAAQNSKVKSYQDLMFATYGKFGWWLTTFQQFFQPFFAMISYNVIIGDTITRLISRIGGASIAHSAITRREFVIFLGTIFLTLPLSSYRNIHKLGKWSAISNLFIALLCIFTAIRLGTLSSVIPSAGDDWTFAKVEALKAITIMSHAFMCHHNALLVYNSMEEPGVSRWSFVVHISVVASVISMLSLALFGYCTFKGYTEGDLLNNYCYSDDFANAARVVFTLVVGLTYPIECFVTREVAEILIRRFFKISPDSPTPLLRHLIITSLIVSSAFALSLTTGCLKIVLEIDGCLAAIPLIFILPTLAYIKSSGHPFLSKNHIVPAIVFFFGLFIMIVSFVQIVQEIIAGVKCQGEKDMPYCMKNFTRTE